jgi:hypothetical protein
VRAPRSPGPLRSSRSGRGVGTPTAPLTPLLSRSSSGTGSRSSLWPHANPPAVKQRTARGKGVSRSTF